MMSVSVAVGSFDRSPNFIPILTLPREDHPIHVGLAHGQQYRGCRIVPAIFAQIKLANQGNTRQNGTAVPERIRRR